MSNSVAGREFASKDFVGVIGAGYVGLTSAACLADLGHRVLCMDIDTDKVAQLSRGEVALNEPGLPAAVASALARRTLSFTTELGDLSTCGIVLVCLPTPMGEDGDADIGALASVLPVLSDVLPADAVVITKSTVPVGTSEFAERLIGRPDVHVVSNPEFLREGHAVEDFRHPCRVVIGADDAAAADAVERLYRQLDAPVVRTDRASAELAKYASNAFLAMKVSYANALAELCERLGADMAEVGRIMGLDDRIGPHFLTPGPGWGGSCLPKDTEALLRIGEARGMELGLVRAAVVANEHQRERVVEKVRTAVTGSADGTLTGVRLGLLGLTFKAGTADLRDSPALAIAHALDTAGAVLTAYDPAVSVEQEERLAPIRVVDDPYLVAKDAAAIVLLTEWPEFAELDWARLAAIADRPVVVDTRQLLDDAVLEGTDVRHIGVGR